MPKRLKLILVAGARPNFMKVAPLVRRIQAWSASTPSPVAVASRPAEVEGCTFDYRLVHTGQHYDQKMSDIFFAELGIPAPEINLEVGSGSHATQTANVMLKFEPVCLREKPDWVVVVGDVNSTMACALVACKLGIKVAHVEAGLRSFDRTMPEEINRLVTDAVADLLLTPSADANENLQREGVPDAKIRLVGNIMIDTLVANLEQARSRRILGEMDLKPKQFAYVTLHRPSNVDERESLCAVMEELARLARQMPVVFPMHPRTRKMAGQFGINFQSNGSLKVLEPIGYHDSLCLTENARLVITDSGGLQEETTFFRTPCLTLRPNTERPITISLGSNRLTSRATLGQDIATLLQGLAAFGKVPPLWDGHAADRTLTHLVTG